MSAHVPIGGAIIITPAISYRAVTYATFLPPPPPPPPSIRFHFPLLYSGLELFYFAMNLPLQIRITLVLPLPLYLFACTTFFPYCLSSLRYLRVPHFPN